MTPVLFLQQDDQWDQLFSVSTGWLSMGWLDHDLSVRESVSGLRANLGKNEKRRLSRALNIKLPWTVTVFDNIYESRFLKKSTLNIYFLLIVADQWAWQISQEKKGPSIRGLLAIIVCMALSKEIKTSSTSPMRSMSRQTDEPTGRGSQIIKSHLSAPFKAFNSPQIEYFHVNMSKQEWN